MARGGLRGAGKFAKRLEGFDQAVQLEIAAGNRAMALALQKEVVARVPVKTGETRAAFADPEAVGLSKISPGVWEFGLRNARLKALGFRAKWIEFGTKGYSAGDKRTYIAKTGPGNPVLSALGRALGRPRAYVKQRTRTLTRDVPARPAQPFFRPALAVVRKQARALYKAAIKNAARKVEP